MTKTKMKMTGPAVPDADPMRTMRMKTNRRAVPDAGPMRTMRMKTNRRRAVPDARGTTIEASSIQGKPTRSSIDG
jgi:hypothetical protein